MLIVNPRTNNEFHATATEPSLVRMLCLLESVDTMLLAEFGADRAEGAEGAGELAARVGATAGLVASSADGPGEAVDGAYTLGCWHGTQDELQQLRTAGYGGLILKNACNGDVAFGSRTKQPSLAAQGVTFLIKAALSKGDKTVWGGAGGTGMAATGKNEIQSYFNRDDQPPRRI